MTGPDLSNSLMIADLGLGAVVGPQRRFDIAPEMLQRWRWRGRRLGGLVPPAELDRVLKVLPRFKGGDLDLGERAALDSKAACRSMGKRGKVNRIGRG